MKKNKTEQHKGKLTPNAVLNEVGGAVKRVIIDDIVAYHDGRKEDELPSNQKIRFENKNFKYTIGWDESTGNISIYKISKGFDKGDEINIKAQSCNRITIE